MMVLSSQRDRETQLETQVLSGRLISGTSGAWTSLHADKLVANGQQL